MIRCLTLIDLGSETNPNKNWISFLQSISLYGNFEIHTLPKKIYRDFQSLHFMERLNYLLNSEILLDLFCFAYAKVYRFLKFSSVPTSEYSAARIRFETHSNEEVPSGRSTIRVAPEGTLSTRRGSDQRAFTLLAVGRYTRTIDPVTIWSCCLLCVCMRRS